MTLVRPVRGRLVSPAWAARVVSPLHDVLTEEERQVVLAGNPDSYLHVSSPVLVGGAPGDVAAGGVRAGGPAGALRRLIDEGAYPCLAEPGVFVYRMREPAGEHTGVVANVGLAGFVDGRVLGHESVQPARVEGLVRHHDQVPARSELVALFHRTDPAVTGLVARVRQGPVLLDFTDVGGVEQTVWRADAEEAAALLRCLDQRRHYIADGHHRVAAALRRWERDGRPDDGSVLCALYPQDQVVLHAFHRRVHGPVAVAELLDALRADFDVRATAGPESVPGSIGTYAGGRWHLLTPRSVARPAGVAGLDVTLLHERVLRPLLGVEDGDPRLELLPELRDLEATVRGCDEDGGVLFTLHAPSLDDVIAVAERREVMSAKTTYVKPKPRTGIFLQ